MGYVVIPVIDVKLPIYHYTSEKVFKKGAGHLCGSSLPIGGIGTHAVLSAHRGLPSAKMFTDLNLLKKGDCFYMHILNRKMAYKVDQIKTVKPSKTEALQIDKNCDYVTLVTCTPYGVNSHNYDHVVNAKFLGGLHGCICTISSKIGRASCRERV